jgi:hypothetical protein
MNRRGSVLVLLLVLVLMGGVGAAAAIYLKTDRREPELSLRTDVVTEYGESLSMYELIDRVDDESAFTLSVSCPQGTLSADGKNIDFPGVGSYQVELTARDEHGNYTTQFTTVEVEDTTPPELKAEEFNVYVGREPDYLEHVAAQDKADGDLTDKVNCSSSQVDLKKPGRYPISYSVTDRAGNTTTITSYVTVSYAPAKKITLSEKEIWLSGNEYLQLTAKVKPSDWHGTVEWKSDHPNVAQVSDGLVVWKGEGECVITATAGKQVASCTVHCEPPAATEVRLSNYKLKLKEGETAVLTARVLPSNWTGTVDWWSSDPSVATVDETGTVTWVSGGSCTITAGVGEFTAECEVTCGRSSMSSLLDQLLGRAEENNNSHQQGQRNWSRPQTEPAG